MFEKLVESITNKINENETPKVELTDLAGMDVKEAEEAIKAAYTEGITYRGKEFFDSIYMDKIVNFASKKLEIGETYEYEEELEDEDTGDIYTEPGTATIAGQESYLGYLPDLDVFVSGWDMFEDESGDSPTQNLVYVKFDKNMQPKDAFKSGYYTGSDMMYPETYKNLKRIFPQIIDIRLD